MSELAHEALTIVIGLFTGLLGILFALLAWLGKGLHADVKDHTTAIAVLRASKVEATVDQHGGRLSTLEAHMSELRGDVKAIREWVDEERQRRKQ